MDRIGLLTTFSMTAAISQDSESCQFPFVLDEKATVVAGGAVGKPVEQGVKRCLIPLARTQSERRRRLALASGFLLLRSFGIDRLDAPAHGSAGPDG